MKTAFSPLNFFSFCLLFKRPLHSILRPRFSALLAMWVSALLAGIYSLWSYDWTPGESKPAPEDFPPSSGIQPRAGRATLVMLLHPQCSCSRASLAEMERLQAAGDFDAWVLFLKPEEAAPDWEKTDLWDRARNIPGVQVRADFDGQAARTFGAETSGHVLFYDSHGTLRYQGGITASRGHEGPSAGAEAIFACLRGAPPPVSNAPTFGCALASP